MTNSQKVNLSLIIIGTVFLIVAAILVIITFIKYDTMVFMIIIIVILGLASESFRFLQEKIISPGKRTTFFKYKLNDFVI